MKHYLFAAMISTMGAGLGWAADPSTGSGPSLPSDPCQQAILYQNNLELLRYLGNTPMVMRGRVFYQKGLVRVQQECLANQGSK